jgi:hypothetical protein
MGYVLHADGKISRVQRIRFPQAHRDERAMAHRNVRYATLSEAHHVQVLCPSPTAVFVQCHDRVERLTTAEMCVLCTDDEMQGHNVEGLASMYIGS